MPHHYTCRKISNVIKFIMVNTSSKEEKLRHYILVYKYFTPSHNENVRSNFYLSTRHYFFIHEQIQLNLDVILLKFVQLLP